MRRCHGDIRPGTNARRLGKGLVIPGLRRFRGCSRSLYRRLHFEDVTFGVVARGTEELRGFVSRAFAAVPDFRYEVNSHFVTTRWAAIEWAMSGTHRGDFPGIPATGRSFSGVRGSTILELASGKIRRESDYWDSATFMKQVCLLPSQ
jgi:steroid delta-isomerase-like uncharacterized protein